MDEEEKAASEEESNRHSELRKENKPLIKEHERLKKELDIAFRSGELQDETDALSDKVRRYKELAGDLTQKKIFSPYDYQDRTPWEKQLAEEEKVLEAAREVQEKRKTREARKEGVRYWQEVFPQ